MSDHKCPCTDPIEGVGFFPCPTYDCKITKHLCKQICTRLDYRELYENGMGPFQDGASKLRQEMAEKRRATAQKKLGGSVDNNCKQKKKNQTPRVFRLGDNVETALKTVGITSERVSAWLGRPCGCPERKRRLNNLGAWAHRILTGKTESAKEYLEEIIGDPEKQIEGQ